MSIWYEDFHVIAKRQIHSITPNDRTHILQACMIWCDMQGFKFIQADFEHKVCYYEVE
jgi:hypothetical protein